MTLADGAYYVTLYLADSEVLTHPTLRKLPTEDLAGALKQIFRNVRTVSVEQAVNSAAYVIKLKSQP